ncbi:MAG TPA: hypothetical protein VFU00_05460 [Gemmatimonadales bacterium]|nr:hypothetical protein [Gemmatimonadales bacterium]
MEGILALSLPIIGVLTIGAVFISRGPIGQALARRIAAGAGHHPADSVSGELAELRRELDQLHAGFAELQEQLDFTERLLAQTREPSHALEGR